MRCITFYSLISVPGKNDPVIQQVVCYVGFKIFHIATNERKRIINIKVRILNISSIQNTGLQLYWMILSQVECWPHRSCLQYFLFSKSETFHNQKNSKKKKFEFSVQYCNLFHFLTHIQALDKQWLQNDRCSSQVLTNVKFSR